MQPLAATSQTPPISTKQAARNQTDLYLIGLMEGIAHGNQDSFAAFYDQTHRLVFGLALRILNDRGIAEEVTTDVFMQVWRQAGNFETMRGTPLSWLMTIARTRSIDRLRASSHLRQENETLDAVTHKAASAESPEKASIYAERQKLVREALTQLTPDQRVLIEAAYFEGLSQSELAERFSLPLGTVKTRVRAGMMLLKKHLAAKFFEN
jgi:RNA polymerase sigma-70 factor (ECF subfamily)